MARIVLDGVTKRFPDGTTGVRDLNLHIEDGGFVVLVGPSGSGKTTALRLIAGLEDVTDGTIVIGDRPVQDVPARERDIAMVFQSYALYPHMSVRDNMAFGLKLRRIAKPEIDRRVGEAATMLGIGELLPRRPRQLSGGQRQRVAMGRAIVREPAAFLMDEPLSNLDAKLRVQMRAEIARLHQRLGTTTVYVTHDQIEAMTLGTRVAVMRRGTIEQVDAPQVLYEQPRNLFVAGFIGSPAMNLVAARLDAGSASFGSHRLAVPRAPAGPRDVILGIRPESIEDAALAPEAGSQRTLDVGVSLVEPLGSEVLVHVEVDAPPVRTQETLEAAETEDAPAGERATFTARLDPRTRAKAGSTLRLAVDVERLYLFDPGSGRRIDTA